MRTFIASKASSATDGNALGPVHFCGVVKDVLSSSLPLIGVEGDPLKAALIEENYSTYIKQVSLHLKEKNVFT